MKSRLEPEYTTEYDAWQQQPSKTTTGALLRKVEPVISNALRSYGNVQASPTLRSRARRLAVDAFSSYDPARGSLRSHLLSRLQRLRRVAGQERQIIRVPEQVTLDQMRTGEAAAELEDRLGRQPSDAELADYTGLSVRRLGHIRRGLQPVAEGTLAQAVSAEQSSYDPAIRAPAPTNDIGAAEFIYDDLDPVNQFILERTLGLHGHPRMPAVAIAKELRLTPGAVSHRMRQIQQQLDELEDVGGI